MVGPQGRPAGALAARARRRHGRSRTLPRRSASTSRSEAIATARSRALRVLVEVDAGAYPLLGPMLANNTATMSPGAYRITRSNGAPRRSSPTPPRSSPTAGRAGPKPPRAHRAGGRPVRGPGRSRSIEVRRRNLLGSTSPRTPRPVSPTTAATTPALDVPLVGRRGSRAGGPSGRRRRRKLLGIGVATFVDRTAGVPGSEFGAVELADGGMLRHHGSTLGQGHHTGVGDAHRDHAGCRSTASRWSRRHRRGAPRRLTGGSRSRRRRLGGGGKQYTLVAEAREVAARSARGGGRRRRAPTRRGSVLHIIGSPVRRRDVKTRAGLARRLAERVAAGGPPPTRALRARSNSRAGRVPFGAYVAVVEVNRTRLGGGGPDAHGGDDAGTIINPPLALGQVHGGLARARSGTRGVPLRRRRQPAGQLRRLRLAVAADLPVVDACWSETQSPNNPLSAKGIAESGTIGAPPADQNTVVDALAHLGVRHIDLPLTPERVWRAAAGWTADSNCGLDATEGGKVAG